MMNTLLFTGASGFLGRNILPILSREYQIKTLGIHVSDDYCINIADEIPILNNNFDIVLHAAGKAHSVPRTPAEEQIFYDINLQGTKNLCRALEISRIPKSFIFISTVAVYGSDFGENITEESPLNGTTPYALSKRLAEEYLTEWCKKYGVVLSILRPSLLAGPNPPGNLGAMIKGIQSGRYLSINAGKAKKSVLMVQDIALLIPLLENKGGIYNICDTSNPSFRQLENIICQQSGKSLPISIPYWMAKSIALIGDCLGDKAPINSLKLNKIVKSLTFSNEKAIRELGWKPIDVLSTFKIK